ncbi:YdeI/OmpD-associated family protein [Arthrobacter rhombi]|uniref:YdeI/OmpD-associated family protein n=1 Tax=Arthrobacter rhombi TaxID=71253 RepID=UPI003FD49179
MAITLPELLVPDAAVWREWLAEHHIEAAGVRLVLHKQGGKTTTLTRAAALDEALCFGWIDGQAGRRDEGSYLLRFTPRRSGSAWSAINVGLVDRLVAAGRMAPAGMAEVEAARADGRWDSAYVGQATAKLSEELSAALDANPAAGMAYARLNSTNRYALYYRIHTLKREESKTRKIAEFVAMLERGQAPYAQPGFAEAPKRRNTRT